MTADQWLAIGQSLVLRAPSLIIGAIGLWFAVARRSLHPRVQLLRSSVLDAY
jgi:hypothetical protein